MKIFFKLIYFISFRQNYSKHFDKDDSGFIDKSELFEAMKKFNPSITKEQIDNICKKVDKDNSGKISLDGKLF